MLNFSKHDLIKSRIVAVFIDLTSEIRPLMSLLIKYSDLARAGLLSSALHPNRFWGPPSILQKGAVNTYCWISWSTREDGRMHTALHLNAPHALKACAYDTSQTLPFTQREPTLVNCLHQSSVRQLLQLNRRLNRDLARSPCTCNIPPKNLQRS